MFHPKIGIPLNTGRTNGKNPVYIIEEQMNNNLKNKFNMMFGESPLNSNKATPDLKLNNKLKKQEESPRSSFENP